MKNQYYKKLASKNQFYKNQATSQLFRFLKNQVNHSYSEVFDHLNTPKEPPTPIDPIIMKSDEISKFGSNTIIFEKVEEYTKLES